MNIRQSAILSYLIVKGGYVAPAEIGRIVGGQPCRTASSWACQTLKILVGKGWVRRQDPGRYAATPKGKRQLTHCHGGTYERRGRGSAEHDGCDVGDGSQR